MVDVLSMKRGQRVPCFYFDTLGEFHATRGIDKGQGGGVDTFKHARIYVRDEDQDLLRYLVLAVYRDSHGGPQGVVQVKGNDLNRHAVVHVRRAQHTACGLPLQYRLRVGVGVCVRHGQTTKSNKK